VRACSIARTLEVVGEKWALLAVREVFLGVRRFDEIVARTGAPRDTLTARLRTLVAHDVLARRLYCERPPRYEYVLTDAGRALYPVILTLMQWGDRHQARDGAPPLLLEHSCGARLDPVLTCRSCTTEVDASDVRRVAADQSGSWTH
jgi:DNA-binding HxlR family transcriptional regulator